MNVQNVASLKEVPESLFTETSFLVEADRFAQSELRRTYGRVLEWWDEPQGYNLPVGFVDGRPVHIEIRWARLCNFRVMFYHGASPLVDRELIEQVLDEHVCRRRTGRYCDAGNFRHCILFVAPALNGYV